MLNLALQLLKRLQVLSDFSIVHGDIQPGNMLMGRAAENCTVHLIDFGLSQLDNADQKDEKMFRRAFSRVVKTIFDDRTSNNETALR